MKPATRQVYHLLRLRGRDGLTEAEATAAIACRRLAARIHELRAEGIAIEAVPERTPMGAVIRRYYLARAPFAPIAGVQEEVWS